MKYLREEETTGDSQMLLNISRIVRNQKQVVQLHRYLTLSKVNVILYIHCSQMYDLWISLISI